MPPVAASATRYRPKLTSVPHALSDGSAERQREVQPHQHHRVHSNTYIAICFIHVRLVTLFESNLVTVFHFNKMGVSEAIFFMLHVQFKPTYLKIDNVSHVLDIQRCDTQFY